MSTDRDQLAAALEPHIHLRTEGLRREVLSIAVDNLLPVVDAIARHRAATELRAAAEHGRMPRNGANICRVRADALERQDPQ
jgi:hypothetical protein